MIVRLYALLLTLCGISTAESQVVNNLTVNDYEVLLADVMEMVDTHQVKRMLSLVEEQHAAAPTIINRARLGIVYHEVALNLSFLANTDYKGYGQESYKLLSALSKEAETPVELRPFVDSYRASALALYGAEVRKLSLIGESFELFERAVKGYAEVSYLPEFLRGSVAENLPWFFLRKRKHAKRDYQSIIDKQVRDPQYAPPKIMSFVYWGWANQHRKAKDRKQALLYLKQAIQLDPDYDGGRAKAEALLKELSK